MKACEHGVSAGTAQRELAVGPLESHATFGQLVKVGCLHHWMVVATQRVIQIIGDQEKNVWTLRSVGMAGKRRENGNEYQYKYNAFLFLTPSL